MGFGVGGRFKREGTYVYLWLIHIAVWQKPTWYCKAIILQLKKKAWFFAKNVHSECIYELQKIRAGKCASLLTSCGPETLVMWQRDRTWCEQETLGSLPLHLLHCLQRTIMCIGSSHFIIRSFSKNQFCSYFIYWKNWNRYLILWKVSHL